MSQFNLTDGTTSEDFKNKLIEDGYGVDEETPNNQFVTKQLHIMKKNPEGIAFTITFNSDNLPSSLTVEDFKMARFNIAEGFSPEDILGVANQITDGTYKTGKTLFSKRRVLIFQTSRGEVKAVETPRKQTAL